jgi:hypothetical protein
MAQSRLLTVPPIGTVRITPLWHVAKDGDPMGLVLYERHYSCYQYADGRERRLFVGPGEKLVLLTGCGRALWVWRRFVESDQAEPSGVNCAVFRNESDHLSSDLIAEAERVAWCRWPGERLYTYVDPASVRSRNPGYCYKVCGWKRGRTTPRGLVELYKEES